MSHSTSALHHASLCSLDGWYRHVRVSVRASATLAHQSAIAYTPVIFRIMSGSLIFIQQRAEAARLSSCVIRPPHVPSEMSIYVAQRLDPKRRLLPKPREVARVVQTEWLRVSSLPFYHTCGWLFEGLSGGRVDIRVFPPAYFWGSISFTYIR